MAQEQPNLIALEQAAAVVPPDVAAARLALQGVGAELVQSNDRAAYAERVADVTKHIANQATEEAVVLEFAAHTNSYSALASVFGEAAPVQPTRTRGKRMSGGKK